MAWNERGGEADTAGAVTRQVNISNPARARAYSRRINIQHRIVYEVFATKKTVRVLRMN
jgi:Txe/YoeB family toxin of Txe-Axe toxin-antitoxin module